MHINNMSSLEKMLKELHTAQFKLKPSSENVEPDCANHLSSGVKGGQVNETNLSGIDDSSPSSNGVRDSIVRHFEVYHDS
jgi:hypothetical protein